MPQNIFEIGERENRVLGIVKAKYGLKNKNQALKLILRTFEGELLDPELRPEFIEELRTAQKEKTVKVKNWDKHFGLHSSN